MEDRRGFFAWAMSYLAAPSLLFSTAKATPNPIADKPAKQDGWNGRVLFDRDPRKIILPIGARLDRRYVHECFSDGVEMICVSAAFAWNGDDPGRMMDDLTAQLVRGWAGCRAMRSLVGHGYGDVYYADYAFTLSAFPEQE